MTEQELAAAARGFLHTAFNLGEPETAVSEHVGNAFTAWASTRLPWREHVIVTGDERTAANFLDALNLV